MREIHDHKTSPANNELKIEVRDNPGSGGANHRYDITGFDTENNPSSTPPDGYKSSFSRQIVIFQNGPVPESGVNGVTQEALIAICIDRLRGFQAGPYFCRENAIALTNLETALMYLQKRTRDRMFRGVEGTMAK